MGKSKVGLFSKKASAARPCRTFIQLWLGQRTLFDVIGKSEKRGYLKGRLQREKKTWNFRAVS